MKRLHGFTPERLAELIARFPNVRVAVVGDFFLDRYFDVDPALEERSLETGLPAHQVVGVRSSPGAAGTVVNNLVALDAGEVIPIGFVGDDGEGYELIQNLRRRGCPLEQLFQANGLRTPTYLKPRNITDLSLRGEHPRYDIKNRMPIPCELEAKIVACLEEVAEKGVHAVVVADQIEESFHGVITPRVRQALADLAVAYPRTIFWADSRRFIRLFRRLIIKPNYREAFGIEEPPELARGLWDKYLQMITELRRQNDAPVVVTCGDQGMIVTDPELTWIPAVRLEGPVDPTGAGDSVTAGAVLALAVGATLPEAALVGTLVASITAQQLATTGTASRTDLPAQLELWLAQQETIAAGDAG